MPDPINSTETAKPEEEGGAPDWLGVKARGDFDVLIGTSVTGEGLGGGAGAQVEYGYDDAFYYIGPEWRRHDTDGKRGDGTASSNEMNAVGVVFGDARRRRSAGGERKAVLLSGSETTLSYAWLNADNSDHYVDGVTNNNTGSEKGMFLSQTHYGGLELYADERMVIMPKIGISMSTFYPFNGVDEQSQVFANPRGIALLFGLNIGLNDNNKNGTQEASLNDFDTAGEFADDAVDILQTILAHQINAAMVRGRRLLEDNEMAGGPSSQETEDIAPLQALSSGFGALGVGDEVGFIHKAWVSERRAVAIAKLVEKGVAGLAFSVWGGAEGGEGADLLGTGLTGLQTGAAGLMSLSTLDPRAQDAIRWGVGTALLLIGGAAGSMGLATGGMNGALGATWEPDATNAKIVSATTVSYYPWTKFGRDDMDGSRGALRKVVHLPIARNVNLTASSEIRTHVLGVGNAGGRVSNAFTEADDPYSSVFLPTSLGSGLGVEYEFHLGDRVMIVPGADVFATQEFGSYSKAGIGAGAELALMIRLYKKTYLDIRSRAVVEQMMDGPASFELLPIAAGLTLYTDDLFLF